MVCGYADGSSSRSASAARVTQPAHSLTRGKRAASRTATRAPARASRHATVLPPGPPPTTRTSEAVIRAAAPPARRAGRRAARAGARSRSQRAWPRRCRPRCRARRRCMPRRSGATWAGGRYAGTRRASGTRPRSRSRPSCPRRWSSRPRDGRRAGPRGTRRRAGGARPPPLRADPGAPRTCPPSSAPAASWEAPFKRPRARAIVRRVSAAPVTLEGWYVLHSMYAVDWPRWNALGAAERDAMVAEATALLERQSAPADGHSACWTLLGHKGDLCLMHWRRDLEALRAEEVALARTRLRAFLVPTYSYLSVIELGTYELAGHAEARLKARGVAPDAAPLEEEMRQLAALAALVLAAAVLYSSVGHAGASAYLAAMGLFGVAPAAMRPAALVMNVVVATAGTWRFASAGVVPWRLLTPLCAASVPAAFVGGAVQLPARVYAPLLALTLVFGAWRLWAQLERADLRPAPGARVLLAVGAGFGLLAGLTGIGGGIFLSPTLILAGWETPRRTAGASVTFILANSIAGLLGHLSTAGRVPPGTALLAAVALAGGLWGSWLGAHRLPPLAIRRLLAVVLVVAGVKLLLSP